MSYDSQNVFARILRGELPCIKVYEDAYTLCFMDIMPQSEGHTLIVPKEAAETLLDLSPEAAGFAIQTTQKIAQAIKKALQPPGIMIAQFNGAAAGQTVPHIHFHVIPKYAQQALKPHAGQHADTVWLESLAQKIRAAL